MILMIYVSWIPRTHNYSRCYVSKWNKCVLFALICVSAYNFLVLIKQILVSLISSTRNLSKFYVSRNLIFVLFTYRTSKLDNELASSVSIGVPLMSKSNSLPRLDESNEINCEFYACIYVNDFKY